MKLIFYFDYMGALGGLSNLWISFFEELHKRKIDFLFFNYQGSDMHKIMIQKGIDKYLIDMNEFDWKKINSFISSDDIIIITSFDQILYKFLPANPKIIYYDISQYVEKISAYKWGLNFKFLGKKLIKKLDLSYAHAAMDIGRIKEVNRAYQYQIRNKNYIPVCIKPASRKYLKTPEHKLVFSYIGRSVIWKMQPLYKIIEDTYSNIDFAVDFHIIVNSISGAKKIIPFKNFEDKINFIFAEGLSYKDLNEYILKTDIHIGFAMGTAALDFAKYGIPTIVVDFSNQPFPKNYQYLWLKDTKEFCLGDDIEKGYQIPENSNSLGTIFEKIIQSKEYLRQIGNESYTYVSEFHNVKHCTDILIDLCNKTNIHLKNVQSYTPFLSNFHNFLKTKLSND